MQLTPNHIIFRSEFHPHPPIPLLDFFNNKLKVSKKYITLVMGSGAEHLGRSWRRHVHLLGIIEPQIDYFNYIQSCLAEEDIWLSNKALHEHPLEEDSIDTVVLLHNTPDITNLKKELNRVLRLNSYVVQIKHKLSTSRERTFEWAFNQFFKQYSTSGFHEYEYLPSTNELQLFFENDYQKIDFPNQIRLSWEALQGYYIASVGALDQAHPKFGLALKALKIIFEQYQIEGEVVLNYQTHVFYGIFNKYVPAISLRKNIFFNLLRPFAFAFYLLVKFNIYLLKSLYMLRPNKKSTSEEDHS